MTANTAFLAPIGSVLSWSDGTPRPPERHRKRLSAWKTNNSSGLLIRKQDEHACGNITLPATVTLHEGDFGGSGVISVRVYRTFSLDSGLTFTIAERSAIGSYRVFDRPGDDAELVRLAANRQTAEEWLSRHGYPRAVLEEVTADEIAADIVEGRAVA